MNRNVAVRSGWHISEHRFRDPGPPSVPTMADSGEIDLRSLFRTIYRRKWMLIGTMVAGMGATMLWLAQATPYYDAEALIVVESRPSSIVRVGERAQDLIGDDAKVTTEMAVLESRSLATRVIRSLGLDRDPEFAEDAPARDEPAGAARETPSGGVPAQAVSGAFAAISAAFALSSPCSASPLSKKQTAWKGASRR